tara:strand:+ start:401 stop:571 length:171 start_codon:yes stop_codon:yes gene_type:complete
MRNFFLKLEIAGELIKYLWKQKLWWAIPTVAVMLFFGIIIVVGSSTGIGPFIYTLF